MGDDTVEKVVGLDPEDTKILDKEKTRVIGEVTEKAELTEKPSLEADKTVVVGTIDPKTFEKMELLKREISSLKKENLQLQKRPLTREKSDVKKPSSQADQKKLQKIQKS